MIFHDPSSPNKWRQLWPSYLCGCLMVLALAVGTYATEHWGFTYFIYLMWMSMNIGLFSLTAVVGGLMGRTWIAGWLYSVVFASIGTIACAAVNSLKSFPDPLSEYLALCALWPLLMLGCTAPLGLMRSFRGWSLTTREDILRPRRAIRIEDLFLLSVIVASSISLARVTQEFTNGMPEGQELILLAVCFVFSFLFALPTVAITFRTRSWIGRLIGWSGLIIASIAACFILNWLMETAPGNQADAIATAAGIGVAWLVICTGAVALLLSGVKLTRFAPATTIDPAEPVSANSSIDSSAKLQARVLTGTVAVVALLSAVGLSLSTYRQTEFLRRVQNYKADFRGFANDCTIRDEEVIGIRLAPEVTDQDLDRLKGSSLERLSLSETQITDAGLEKLLHIHFLGQLDLSNTAITGAGLQKLSALGSLASLSVAHTKVDFKQALEVARLLNIQSLDVSGTGITDQQLGSKFEFAHDIAIKLSKNPLTDIGIANFLQQSFKLSKLDLSDLPIDGSGLLFANCPIELNLDGTQITDASLTALLNFGQCQKLSVRRTAITAAVLPLLANKTQRLVLGECAITEQDLANLPPVHFTHLGLNDRKFTGTCFRGGNIQAQSVDLSRSGVTDSTLENLRGLGYLTHLDLSHTEISDAGLKWIQCNEVDLRSTKVTAQGLLKEGQAFSRILLSHDQFTPGELVALRKVGAVIDEAPHYRQ